MSFTFSLFVRSLSMFAIMCLLTWCQVVSLPIVIPKLTLVITSLNSRVMPAFMMRGFLQIAFAILSSTRRPIASW